AADDVMDEALPLGVRRLPSPVPASSPDSALRLALDERIAVLLLEAVARSTTTAVPPSWLPPLGMSRPPIELAAPAALIAERTKADTLAESVHLKAKDPYAVDGWVLLDLEA